MDKCQGINNNNNNNSNNLVMRFKRKELEEVNDDFSEFSLSSPARKIRRLDAELLPIVEEDNADIPMRNEQVTPNNVTLNGAGDQLQIPDIEELPSFVPENEERALVLFKPMGSSPSFSGSNFSIDPKLIASFKNQAFWCVNSNTNERSLVVEDLVDEDDEGASSCRAVIPWVPVQQPNLKPEISGSQVEMSEEMDAEDTEATTMEIEDGGQQQTTDYYHLSRFSPHCTFPQPLENTTTPVVWYR